MSDTKLGTLLTLPRNRDAIHIAIIPAISREALDPGEHVGIVNGATMKVSRDVAPVGIVDPFLTYKVPPLTPFWLLLYQGTTKNLRHDWSHPDVSDSEASEALEESDDECRNCQS